MAGPGLVFYRPQAAHLSKPPDEGSRDIPEVFMQRHSALTVLLIAALPVAAAAQDSTTPATSDAAAVAAPLVDLPVTIMNQSGQMLMRFEAVPDLGDDASQDESAGAAATTTPTETATGTPTEPAAPDPRTAAGGELLKGAVISAGNYGVLIVPGGGTVCTFTFLSTLADGRQIEADWDLCANQTYTLMPPG